MTGIVAAPSTAPGPPSYLTLEATYSSATPQLVVVGDSRAFWWPSDQLAQFGSPLANLGIGGEVEQQILWRVQNSAINLSQATLILLVAGINNITITQDDPLDLATGIQQTVMALKARAPNARILTQDVYETVYLAEFRPYYTDDRRRELNKRVAKKAEASGKWTHVPLPPMDVNDPTIWRPPGDSAGVRGQIHLNPLGYQVVTAAISAALSA